MRSKPAAQRQADAPDDQRPNPPHPHSADDNSRNALKASTCKPPK
jgi:hypothetical protein